MDCSPPLNKVPRQRERAALEIAIKALVQLYSFKPWLAKEALDRIHTLVPDLDQ